MAQHRPPGPGRQTEPPGRRLGALVAQSQPGAEGQPGPRGAAKKRPGAATAPGPERPEEAGAYAKALAWKSGTTCFLRLMQPGSQKERSPASTPKAFLNTALSSETKSISLPSFMMSVSIRMMV